MFLHQRNNPFSIFYIFCIKMIYNILSHIGWKIIFPIYTRLYKWYALRKWKSNLQFETQFFGEQSTYLYHFLIKVCERYNIYPEFDLIPTKNKFHYTITPENLKIYIPEDFDTFEISRVILLYKYQYLDKVVNFIHSLTYVHSEVIDIGLDIQNPFCRIINKTVFKNFNLVD